MSRLVIIAIILVAALGLGLGLVWPKYQHLQLLREEVKQKEAELSSKTEYYSQIKEVAAELEQYQEELAKISSALPQEPSPAGLLHFLQQTASQTGLLLEDIDWKGLAEPDEKEASKVKKINVGLEVSGNYSSLKEFLSALEKSARLIKVTSIDFSFPKAIDESPAFNIAITAHSY